MSRLRVIDFLEGQQVLRSREAPTSPVVSVVLPTYRRRASGQLQRAIESVLAQSFGDLELLVMDDGSTDGSAELIDGIRAKDARVVHVRHEANCGLPSLRVNEGIELARGRYLAFQFDDDTWRPHALARLVEGLTRLDRPGLVIGKAQYMGPWGTCVIPEGELNLVTLYHQNRFANNSVLLAREILDRCGLYDPHIAMRRLCDWDLWLRLIKHIPFVVVDEIIADVYEANPSSIGTTVPWDLALFRYLHDIPRNALLTPAAWRNYAVDALTIGDLPLSKDFRRRAWTTHILPYYLRFRARFPQIEGFQPALPGPAKTVLYTKNSYDVSNDVTLNNFDTLATRRGSYKSHFQLLGQVTEGWTTEADALLLVRAVEDEGKTLVAQARATGKPIGFYLDDDLLTFHQFGRTFDYLAPGTAGLQNLGELLRAADAVWVTTESIAGSVAPHNLRTVPHFNSVPIEYVAAEPRPRDLAQPLRIGYAGSGYRLEDFALIWGALQSISRKWGDRLCFEFWGIDVSHFPALDSPVRQTPFTFSYFEYLTRLHKAKFDILLCPLLDHPTPRLGKSMIKYLEAAVAGAVGVFSDVPPYAALPHGLTCLKVANDAEQWEVALETLIGMPVDDLDDLRRRCVQHVREEFSNVALIDRHEAAWRATEFHALTRAQRHADGRPRVVYFLHSAAYGGGELQLWRRLRLAREYGIEPVVVIPRVDPHSQEPSRIEIQQASEKIELASAHYTCFTVPKGVAEFSANPEIEDVQGLLEKYRPALVHSVTYIPTVGQVCQRLDIPHVASLYDVEDDISPPPREPTESHCRLNQSDTLRYTARWSDLLGTDSFCAREVAPAEFFRLGFERSIRRRPPGQPWRAGPIRLVVTGTLQPRKRQAETIEAVGRLCQAGLDCRLDLYGYTHFFPDYLARCHHLITHWGLQDRVAFQGFAAETWRVLADGDVVLSLSTVESFPSALKEAMAAGLLVVATPIGGIPELVLDGETGILCAGTDVEAIADGIRRAAALDEAAYRRIVEAARRVARVEFHPNRAANDLLTMYLKALEQHPTSHPTVAAPVPSPEEAAPPKILQTVGEPPLDYVALGRARAYALRPHFGRLNEVAVLMGSPLEAPVAGHLVFEVCLADGQVLRRGEVAFTVTGAAGTWVELPFEPLEHSAGLALVLTLRIAGPTPPAVGIFETHHPRSWRERARLRFGWEGVRPYTYAKVEYAP